MPALFQIKSFISYWLNNVDEHSLHSPFFYDFFTKVVKSNEAPDVTAEKLRQNLLQSSIEVIVDDPGAGSVIKSNQRLVKDLARVSLSPAKYSALYARAIEFFRCKSVVELGTSLGINTLYLAKHGTNVYTFEGVPPIAELARDTFSFAEKKNIKLIEGNIDQTLADYLGNLSSLDFAFIDANHRYEATLDYFEKLLNASGNHTILVFDDIHLNAGMEKAWNAIKAHELVHATADLYRCGFVFLDPSLNRQHWVLRF